MKESQALADFIVNTEYEDIPTSVLAVQKKALLDAISVTLAAGTLGEGCKQFAELAMESGGKQESTILGYNVKVSAAMAAFANGAMAHSLDFEDAHDRALVHSNAAAIPAALAIAEAQGNISGKEFLAAITIGSDIVCRMGLALEEDLLKYGWYMPPILEAFGATAAVCKLLKLSSKQILDAFSLTLCQVSSSGELINSPQSAIRSVRDAFSAKAGVVSALLAQKGITGFAEPLEGKSGFYNMYTRGKYDLSALTSELGKTYESANISFKPWPSCRGTHPYIEGVLQIIKKQPILPFEIERIHVIVSSVNKMLCEPREVKLRPESPINAKFSIPFMIATAIIHQGVTLDHFTPQALNDHKVLELASKVTYEVNNTLTKEQALHGETLIFTTNGMVSAKVIYPLGHPNNPISQDMLSEKFASCAKYSMKQLTEESSAKFVQTILQLENVENISEIMCFL